MTLEEKIKAKIPGEDTGITVKKSVCGICDPQQCGLSLYVKDGVIIKTEGNENHLASTGSLCSKGASTRQYVYNDKRIKTPLRRVGERGEGKFEPITWEEAMEEIASRLQEIKDKYGPESVMFTTGYAKYYRPFLKRLAMQFGSPNYLSEACVCMEATIIAQKLVYGVRDDNPDLDNTDCLLVWSTNPYHTGVVVAKSIEKQLKRGMKMIVVDPRITPTSSRADLHLRLRPGTDGALALAMANVIITEDLIDHEYVEKYTYGYEEFKQYALTFTPERGEEITGVPAALIREAARMYATAPAGGIYPSASPVVHHTNGVQNYRAVFCLVGLTGNFNRKGGQKVVFNTGFPGSGMIHNNMIKFMNPVPMSSLAKPIGQDQFPVWRDLIGGAHGMAVPEAIRSEKPYPIKAMFGVGFNHRLYPGNEDYLDALLKLDFIVDIDLIHSDFSRYADILLPTCSSVERSEIRFYHNDHLVVVTDPVIRPLYESKPDVDIFSMVSKALKLNDELLEGGFDKCVDYILEPSGLTCAQVRACPDGMRIPKELRAEVPLEDFKNNPIHTTTGKFEFKSALLEKYQDIPGYDPLPVYREPVRSPRNNTGELAQYDLILNTGSRLPMMTHSRMYHVKWTKALNPRGITCDMNPIDAKARGIKDGDTVVVSTPEGSLRFQARLTEMTLPGVINIYHDNVKADINHLIPKDYMDPISGFPGYKSSICKVEREETAE